MKKPRVYFIILIIISILAIYIWIVLTSNKNTKISPSTSATVLNNEVSTSTLPSEKLFQYIEIENACDWTEVGTCVNMRSGPGDQYPVVARLRNGIVLEVGESVVVDGQTWYKIIFGNISYPDRVDGDLYVAQTDSVTLFTDTGDQFSSWINASSTKHIVVDISKEMLYAYDGDTLFMQGPISTGLEFTPTPVGNFFIFKKTPSRYMQGPIPGVSDQYYDLPGVPWDLYFTKDGSVIHGAYWHNKFGQPWSHGCINLPLDQAKKLYYWADAGTPVLVQAN